MTGAPEKKRVGINSGYDLHVLVIACIFSADRRNERKGTQKKKPGKVDLPGRYLWETFYPMYFGCTVLMGTNGLNPEIRS